MEKPEAGKAGGDPCEDFGFHCKHIGKTLEDLSWRATGLYLHMKVHSGALWRIGGQSQSRAIGSVSSPRKRCLEVR